MTRTRLTIALLLSVCTANMLQPLPAATAGKAFSLAALQEEIRNQSGGGHELPRRLLHLDDMTGLDGYVIDEDRGDVILFEESEGSGPVLNLDDVIVSMRNTWKRREAPYLSLEPRPENVQALREIGGRIARASTREDMEMAVVDWEWKCENAQEVVVKGIPLDSHFAGILLEADYAMKKMAIGAESAGEGLSSYSARVLDHVLDGVRRTGRGTLPGAEGVRFWFYPGDIRLLTDDGVVMIDACEVLLLSESGYLQKQGGMRKAGQENRAGEVFAEQFTARFQELGAAHEAFVELEDLFEILTVLQAVKFRGTLEEAGLSLGFLLNGYEPSSHSVPRELPGVPAVESDAALHEGNQATRKIRVWVPFCGGVHMNIQLNAGSFQQDRTGRLKRIRNAVLGDRPSPNALFWSWRD